MPELIKYKGGDHDIFYLKGHEKDKEIAIYYWVGEHNLVCSYTITKNHKSSYGHIFSIDYNEIDDKSSDLYGSTITLDATVHNKLSLFKDFILAIYLTEADNKNNHRFDPIIINYLEKTKNTLTDLWGNFQNLIAGKKVNAQETINLKSKIVKAIIDEANHQSIRDNILFGIMDEEDLLSEVLATGPNYNNMLIEDWPKVIGFYLDRYNFPKATGLLKSGKILENVISKLLLWLTNPLIHLLLLIVGALIFGLIFKPSSFVLYAAHTIFYYSISFTLFYLIGVILLFVFSKRVVKPKVPPPLTLLSPKLVISNIIGWFLILPVLNLFWRINAYISSNVWVYGILIGLLFGLVCLFIYSELKTIKPRIKISDALYRLLVLFFKGLPISLSFGILLMTLVFPLVMHNPNVYSPSTSLQKSIEDLKNIDHVPVQLAELILSPIENAEYGGEPLTLDTVRIFRNQYLKERYVNLEDSINALAMYKISVDSLGSYKAKFDICKANCVVGLRSEIKGCSKELLAYKYDIVRVIAEEECKSSGFPCIVPITKGIFIFPQLLLLGATMSFLIGFFIQFVRTSQFVRHNV
ncbi:MAG: hypothetical protein AAF502_09295 [Bacteroidota bacterium]